MKVGDLVKFDWKWVGMIIEVGVYVGRKDVKVMWQDGSIQTDKSRRLVLIQGGQ